MARTLGLLSFNESNLKYSGCAIGEPQTFPLETVDLLLICTQESTAQPRNSLHEHLQCVTEPHYCLLARNALQLPPFFKILRKGKNVRSSLYIRRDLLRDSSKQCPRVNDPRPYLLKGGSFASTIQISQRIHSYRMGSFLKKGYKSAVWFRIVIEGKVINVINTHLFFQGGGDQGVAERQADLREFLRDWNLFQAFDRGESIIICGDLNFRMNPPSAECPPSNSSEQALISFSRDRRKIQACAQHILDRYKAKDLSTLGKYMELKFSQGEQKLPLYAGLQKSIAYSFPTCRFVTEKPPIQSEADLESWLGEVKMGQALVDFEKKTPRIPSTCDQVLFASKDPLFRLLSRQLVPYATGQMTKSDHLGLIAIFAF
jgi:hypothetical protein